MKIVKNVIIINDFNYIQGGASKVAIDTAKLLKKQGLNIYFFSAVNRDEENIAGIHYITTHQNEALKEGNRLKGLINGIYNFKAKKELKKLLLSLDNKDTIIHIHGWTKALSSSVFDIAFKMNFKVIITLHDYFTACPNGGYFDYKKNNICKRKPLSMKCVMCNCDSRNYAFKIYRVIRQFIQNNLVKLNKKIKYVVGISDLSIGILKSTLNDRVYIEKIYNPIDFDMNLRKIDYKKNDYYLYVGRVSKEKGVDLFCKVITQLHKKGIVVGDGSEKERLEKQYPNIEFVGWKDGEEVKEYMRRARCLIFPSLWYEGAPLTPLEAISIGVPYLISNCCAGREYDEGLVFKDENDLILKLKNDDFKINTEILNKFSSKMYTEKIINYYNRSLYEK